MSFYVKCIHPQPRWCQGSRSSEITCQTDSSPTSTLYERQHRYRPDCNVVLERDHIPTIYYSRNRCPNETGHSSDDIPKIASYIAIRRTIFLSCFNAPNLHWLQSVPNHLGSPYIICVNQWQNIQLCVCVVGQAHFSASTRRRRSPGH